MALELKAYETIKYESWLEETEGKLLSLMKKKLLTAKKTEEVVRDVIYDGVLGPGYEDYYYYYFLITRIKSLYQQNKDAKLPDKYS